MAKSFQDYQPYNNSPLPGSGHTSDPKLVSNTYASMGASLADQDDEGFLDQMIDDMMGMCGNAGQETIISRNAGAFWDWGLDALEEEGAFGEFEDMMDSLDVSWEDHSYQGTVLIWLHGYEGLVGQSHIHDSFDEGGEGTGDEV